MGGTHFDEKSFHGGFGGGAVGDEKLCGGGGGYTGDENISYWFLNKKF